MPDSRKTFYLTTPIYYVNARPHIGHAYTTIVADVLARRHRLLGDDTFFLTGTDEHGQKIERSAAAAGIPPQQFADEVSASFEALWKRMGITNDAYIRTTDPAHGRGVQKLFSALYEKGFIYLASYTGAYCVSDETFVDAPVGTPCPDCGRLLEEVTEENFFFKLSEFQLPLLNLIESNDLKIENDSRRNEVLSFLRGDFAPVFANEAVRKAVEAEISSKGVASVDGMLEAAFNAGLLNKTDASNFYVPGALKDLSISRSSFTWGVPVPEPAASAAAQKHVIYVWLDALANYITALGYGSDDESNFKKFWPADIHLVGKEIIRFHCVYWPAFLLAAGIDLPKQITAHGWLLFDNSKMSKSKGNIVRTETILDAFGTLCPPPAALKGMGFSPSISTPGTNAALAAEGTAVEPAQTDRDLFASDVLRYFLLREIPFGQDGSFSFEALITRYNADLANGYGNLVSRTLNLITQNFEGCIPFAKEPWLFTKLPVSQSVSAFDALAGTSYLAGQVVDLCDEYRDVRSRPDVLLQVQLTDAMLAITSVDAYLSIHKPWRIAKEASEASKAQLSEVLYTAATAIRFITASLYPVMPYATSRVWAQLGLGDIEIAARNGELKNLQWGGLKPGTKLGPLSPIFPRADKGLIDIMTDMENPTPHNTEFSKTTAEQKTTQPVPMDPTHPGAPPRTSSLDEPSGTLSVGGSNAVTTGTSATPSHTEAQASGIFAQQPPAEPAGPADASPQISIDDFVKIELRVAQIVVAERIPKADKLLRLEVDLGYEKRQILSGIAEFYTPEELVGRRIVVITNLAPRKMRGLESHGMLLAASNPGEDHGKPYLATCGDEIALGSRLK